MIGGTKLSKTFKSFTEYIDYLSSKGFSFGIEEFGFIEFGKNYTGASDQVVIIALELTLKIQREFDGAFFISLLEKFKQENIANKKQAKKHLEELNII